MTIILACLLLVNVLTLAGIVGFLLFLRKTSRSIKAFLDPTVDTEGKQGLSPFAQLTQILTAQAADVLLGKVQASLMGSKSGAVRREKAVQAALIEDGIDVAAPGVGAVLDMFPQLKKKLAGNPQLVQLFLNRFMGGGSSQSMPPGSNGHDSAYTLRS